MNLLARNLPEAMSTPRRREPRRDYAGDVLLRTRRLVLRGLCLRDAEDISGLHADPRVSAHLLEKIPLSFLETVGLIAQANHVYRDAPGLGIWHASAPEGFIGLFSLMPVQGNEHEIELGARLMPTAFGRLYSLEGSRALRDHAFARLGLTRLRGFCDPHNAAVPLIFRRLGFSDAGTTEHFGREALAFVLEREAWQARAATSSGPHALETP
jgi:RimJ/RimL family protein N-acetyltransferase